MATEGLLSDTGTIYKRLFNHRAVVQNEVHSFIQEFESKRGDNDLKLLQSCVKLSTDINALYLEEMKESLPAFAEANDKMAEIVAKGNNIMEHTRTDFNLPKDHSVNVEGELQELRDKYANMRQELNEATADRIAELKAEIQVHKETVERLKGGRPSSLGSLSD